MAARPTCVTSSAPPAHGGTLSPCGVLAPAPEGTAADVPEGAAAPAPEGTLAGAIPAAPAARQRLATFRSLYSSRDGALCVYEDEDGHLIAVDASKFA